MLPNTLPLSELPIGDIAHVTVIERGHPLRQRLLELGFVRGAKVQLIRRAPMGDPIQVMIGQTQLALRLQDLRSIQVQR